LKIFVTGTRGIPDIPGGIETHCQQLYPLIARQGHEVLLSRRSSYVKEPLGEWCGVQLVDVFSPKAKCLEAIIHTLLSLLKAKSWGADLVHIHAVGPSIVTPIARLLGLKVIMTNHGPDYDRQKWGKLAKLVLKLGEYIGGKYANNIIVISEHIRGIVKRRCGKNSNLIFNGVQLPRIRTDEGFLRNYGLAKEGYILSVARLVPEKGLHDLIEAYNGMDSSYKLVIAGDSDHDDKYSMSLKESARLNPNIIMPGYVIGEDLAQLLSHARLFVLPSYHEGLPIALLEALSYGLPAVVSNIPANKEVELHPDCYYQYGDVVALRQAIAQKTSAKWTNTDRDKTIEFVRVKYNWIDIANQTLVVYNTTLQGFH